MLSKIVLGPGLRTPFGGFSRAELRVVEREYRTIIADILQACRNNPVPSSVAEEDAICALLDAREAELRAKVQKQAEARGRPVPQGEIMLEALFDYARQYFEIENPFYFGYQLAEIEAPVTLHLAQAEARIAFHMTSADDRYSEAFTLDAGASSEFAIGLQAYWGQLAAAPVLGTPPSALAVFDQARRDLHTPAWGAVRNAFRNAGLIVGAGFADKLYALIATAYPDARNPFPEMVVRAHRASDAGLRL